MRFYHVVENKRQRRIAGLTIATDISYDDYCQEGEHLINCAVSYCAPVERSFSRPRGRTISQSRLSSPRELPGFKKFSFYTDTKEGLKIQVLQHLLSEPSTLMWAKSIVERELNRIRENQ